MNSIIQQQQNAPLQIAGVIRNFRKVPTRTGKPMAAFTVGTLPSKCFDVTVDTAEYWAATGKRVLVAGHLSNHDGTIEFVAQSINLAPSGQADAQTGFSQDSYADISVQEQAPIRERGTITENLSGCVSDLKIVPNRSGRLMITFRIGNSSCKAFRELASAIQKAEGKQIEVSARKGSFRGVTEYAVEIVKTISGTAVNFRDNHDPVSVTDSPINRVESTHHQMREFVAINESERKQITEAIAEPDAGPSAINDMRDFEPFDPVAYGIKPETMQSSRFLSEPAKPAAATTEAEPATETIIAPKPEQESLIKPRNEVVIQDWLDIIESAPSRYPQEIVAQLSIESGDRGEAARKILARREADTAAKTIIAPKTAPAEEVVVEKTPEVQGTISKIRSKLTTDGRNMVDFNIGPHNCYLLDKAAEFVGTHAPDFEGKLIKLYGEWKINECGRRAFFPEERIVATDPAGEVTADEVQNALEEALFNGSQLSSVGGPTLEEMEAEYKESIRSKQQAKSSAVAA
jgi:hypothetical protein